MASLLYGAGLRLLEAHGCGSRTSTSSAARSLVRDGKGRKDRVTMLPASVKEPLRVHLIQVRRQHEADLALGSVRWQLPDALARKYPNAVARVGVAVGVPGFSALLDRSTGERRRHHLHETVLQRAVKQARAGGGDREGGKLPHAEAFVRDAPLGGGARHSDDPGAVGAHAT